MKRAYTAYACLALTVACGETSGDPNDSVAEGGSAGAAGNAASGGNSGNAGSSGASGGTAGGGTASAPECVSAGDCELYSDCCNCIGAAKGEDVVGCDLACAVDECDRQGITEPQCIAGRCVAGFDCDRTKVACAQPSPQCPTGQVAAIAGGCWTGGCVPAVECVRVTQCSDCEGANVACASYQTQLGPEPHCVEIPQSCNGAATCDCLGPSVCVQGFDACQDFSGIKGVACSCPAC